MFAEENTGAVRPVMREDFHRRGNLSPACA